MRMEADEYLEARARFAVGDQPYFLAEVFIEAANDLKTNRIKLPCESTYVFDVNKYPPKPLPKARRGPGGRTRTGSRTRRRRPRRGVASAVNAVTINLHVSTMKFGLIGTTPMTWYSEISSQCSQSEREPRSPASITSVTLLQNQLKTRVNGAKHAKRRDAIFLKNQDKAFKHHHYHHLFFRDRFYCV